MNKSDIIEKHWPKPTKCNVTNIQLMMQAIGEMMDEYAGDKMVVKGCIDCPMNSNDREYGSACQHPSIIDKDRLGKPLDYDENFNDITPDWCPLKKQSITISIEK